jgi:GNAT superfamily N-acetyltransferase
MASLRRAVPADASAVTALVADAYRHYEPLIGRTPLPMLADHAAAIRDHEVWVLTDGDDLHAPIVGVLELVPEPDHLWVENVAIHPTRQGEGLGRRLLAHADARAAELDVPELRLLTNERYLANLAMYARYGYVETHRVPHLGTDLVHFRKPRA